MKLKIIKTIILLSLLSINSNCQNNNLRTTQMKHFDIKKYENYEIDNDFISSKDDLHYKTDSSRIRILFDENTVQVEENYVKTPVKKIYVYTKKNNKLMAEGEYFYGIPIGVEREYNENEILIKETDWDKPFSISIEQLGRIMQERYEINILDRNNIVTMYRYKEDDLIKQPLYEIYVKDKHNDLKTHCYIINGNTGETLFTTTRFMEEKRGSLLDEYLNSLK